MAVVSKMISYKLLLLFWTAAVLLFLASFYFRTKMDLLSGNCSPAESRSHLWTTILDTRQWIGTLFVNSMGETDPNPDDGQLPCNASLASSILHILMFHLSDDVSHFCLSTADVVMSKLQETAVWGLENSDKICTVTVVLAVFGAVCCLSLCLWRRIRNKQTWNTTRCSTTNPMLLEHQGKPYHMYVSPTGREIARAPITSGLYSASSHEVSRAELNKWRIHPWPVIVGVALALACLSLPWEFLRLYQKAVGNRAAVASVGLPAECHPEALSLLQTIRLWLSQQLAWSHGNPCDQYYYALFVDPLWEITPFVVLMSVATRCVVHPVEMLLAGLGRALRSFFIEIPVHWQPVFLLIILTTLLTVLLMTCSYRISVPLLFRIEPRTPVMENAYRGEPRHSGDAGRRMMTSCCDDVRRGDVRREVREDRVLSEPEELTSANTCSCDEFRERAHALRGRALLTGEVFQHEPLQRKWTNERFRSGLVPNAPDTDWSDVENIRGKRLARKKTSSCVSPRAVLHELDNLTGDIFSQGTKKSAKKRKPESPSRRNNLR